MALLAAALLLILGPPAWAGTPPPDLQQIAVIFDPGNPQSSVGIVGKDLLEQGDIYDQDFEVIGFESDAVIVRDVANQDSLKWLQQGEVDAKLFQRAQQLFVVKQLHAVHLAQIAYLQRFPDHYAPDLNTLLDQGLLAGGFDDDIKINYHFRIAATGQTGRLAPHFIREATFFAVAEPVSPEERALYFSVDQLGQVRSAPSLQGVSWGPIWDYSERTGGPSQRRVVLEEE